MEYDEDKVDEMVLALLYLTSFDEHGFVRAWKGHDWDSLNRLHGSGLISDPKNKNKSIVLSDEGARRWAADTSADLRADGRRDDVCSGADPAHRRGSAELPSPTR